MPSSEPEPRYFTVQDMFLEHLKVTARYLSPHAWPPRGYSASGDEEFLAALPLKNSSWNKRHDEHELVREEDSYYVGFIRVPGAPHPPAEEGLRAPSIEKLFLREELEGLDDVLPPHIVRAWTSEAKSWTDDQRQARLDTAKAFGRLQHVRLRVERLRGNFYLFVYEGFLPDPDRWMGLAAQVRARHLSDADTVEDFERALSEGALYLPQLSLDDVALKGRSFQKLELGASKFENLNVDGASFEACQLGHIEVYEAFSACGARFLACNVGGWKMRGANLQGAEFTQCQMEYWRLDECNLSGARFDSLSIHGSVEESSLEGASFESVFFRSFNVFDSNVRRACFAGCSFEESGLSGDLREADFRNTVFRTVNHGSHISGDARGADFRHADLRELTICHDSNLAGALYDEHTVFSDKVDPEALGMVRRALSDDEMAAMPPRYKAPEPQADIPFGLGTPPSAFVDEFGPLAPAPLGEGANGVRDKLWFGNRQEPGIPLAGVFYNAGFFGYFDDPTVLVTDWDTHIKALRLANGFAQALEGVTLSKRDAIPFFPFVYYGKLKDLESHLEDGETMTRFEPTEKNLFTAANGRELAHLDKDQKACTRAVTQEMRNKLSDLMEYGFVDYRTESRSLRPFLYLGYTPEGVLCGVWSAKGSKGR